MGARRCPYEHGTFRAVRWADGPIWIVCRPCRRYVELMMTTDVAERQVSRTTFTCRACGGLGAISSDDPAAKGYKLDARDGGRPRRTAARPAPRPEPPLGPRWRPVF